MQIPRKSSTPKDDFAQQPRNLQYPRYSTILRPTTSCRSSARSSIIREDIELDEKFGIQHLILRRRRRLLKNLFYISTIKAATYLVMDTIANNWTDKTLIMGHYILSNLLLVLVTPFFVPLILRLYTVRTSIRISVLGMTFIILSSYYPYPYVFVIQVFLCAFPESVLCVAVRIYIVRIAKIWSRIDGIDIRTTILRLFAFHNVLLHLRRVFIASINYLQPDVGESSQNSSENLGNATCGLEYCEMTRHLIVSYVYDIKNKNLDRVFILSTALCVVGAGLAIGISVMLDRLDSLSESEFGDRPTACKTIDILLQLCRPRMTYLLGISLYHPFLITFREQYFEAYATCSLELKHDQVISILISLAGLHAILSADVFLDVLGMIGSLQAFLLIFMAISVILSFWYEGATLDVLSIFVVSYVLQYWTSIYGLFVALLTHQIIGDEEIAAWGIHTIIFWVGLTLSQAFHYMCMDTQLQIMIVLGFFVLTMTYYLKKEDNKTFRSTVMNNKIIEALQRKNTAWIADPAVNIDRAIDMGGKILWIETYWRRTVRLIDDPVKAQ